MALARRRRILRSRPPWCHQPPAAERSTVMLRSQPFSSLRSWVSVVAAWGLTGFIYFYAPVLAIWVRNHGITVLWEGLPDPMDRSQWRRLRFWFFGRYRSLFG